MWVSGSPFVFDGAVVWARRRRVGGARIVKRRQALESQSLSKRKWSGAVLYGAIAGEELNVGARVAGVSGGADKAASARAERELVTAGAGRRNG